MDPIKVLVYGWKLVDYPEKLGPEGQFYSPIIWESVSRIKDDYNKLMGYKWNGNVRELYHFLDRIYAEEQRTLESERH